MKAVVASLAVWLVTMCAAPLAAHAQDQEDSESFIVIGPNRAFVIDTDLWQPGIPSERVGRRDVEESLLPPAPTGPASPSPFCSPADPFC